MHEKGPLLIAANHPNSFLDAILLCSIFRQPVYSLARGDAFGKTFYARLLRSLNMLPVYRLSEGAENIGHNYKTFEDCIEIFKQGGIVLIFSEGRCINEWDLRPLKKGTARLSLDAWQQDIPLRIIPAGINYSSFTLFGKNIQLNFGEMITEKNIDLSLPEGNKIQQFNSLLKTQLDELVIKIKPADKNIVREKLGIKTPVLKKILLFIPALIGCIIHAPLYLPIRKFSFKKFGKIDHYDSVVVGMLFIFYPFYISVFTILAVIFLPEWWWIAVIFIMPFTAWSYIQLKRQV